jgi:hypothetical protein
MTQTAQPLIGLGATLSIGTQGGTPTYTAINGVKKITPPKPKWGTEDVTTLATPNTGRRKIKTLLDNGEVAFEGEYESADPGQAAMSAAFLTPSNSASGAAYPFKLVLPIDLAGGQTTIGDTVTFNAMVTGWEMSDVEIDKAVTFSGSLTIDGPVTVTPGS